MRIVQLLYSLLEEPLLAQSSPHDSAKQPWGLVDSNPLVKNYISQSNSRYLQIHEISILYDKRAYIEHVNYRNVYSIFQLIANLHLIANKSL